MTKHANPTVSNFKLSSLIVKKLFRKLVSEKNLSQTKQDINEMKI